jgi:hypothetical protein
MHANIHASVMTVINYVKSGLKSIVEMHPDFIPKYIVKLLKHNC